MIILKKILKFVGWLVSVAAIIGLIVAFRAAGVDIIQWILDIFKRSIRL